MSCQKEDSNKSDDTRGQKSTPAKKTKKEDDTKVNKMVNYCPMPKCNRLEFEDEKLYFNHLIKKHKITG